ncbi:MAG: peptide-binding protein [Candidatus Omnitrophica bacterium]|nr:peptide-binding protein [Candidatus Omnitrophota bacterium]
MTRQRKNSLPFSRRRRRQNKIQKNLEVSRPLLGVIAAMAFIFFAPFASGDDPDYGDALVTAHISDCRTLVPVLASDSASAEIISLVFNGLVKYDARLNLVGDLADSWTISEGGLVIIFHLKKNCRWQDGRPFTADDVVFTYERIIDPSVPTPYKGDFEKVESVKSLDPYTVEVRYREAFAPGLASWGMPVMPRHLLAGQDLLATKFGRNPVGTGPYLFKRWRTGERIDLVSNRDYFEHRPFIDRYIYRVIPDPSTMFLELETGSVDIMGLSSLQYARLTDTARFLKKFQRIRYPSFGYVYMGYNLDNVFFKDIRVRQAINYAVDKNEIIDGVLFGLGTVSTGPFLRDSWAYNPVVQPPGFDPAKAGLLLTEAGWVDTDGDGWREKNGTRFEFTVVTNQGAGERLRAAEIIQRRLKEIGIKMHIRVVEWAVFLNEFIEKRRFEAVILGWNLSRDPDCYDIWHSSKTKPGEFNFLGYKNAEVDALLEAGRRTFDQEERKKIYYRIHRLIYEDQPCLFLFAPDALVAVDRRFEGVSPAPVGIMYNLIDWYVPRDKQRYHLRPEIS